MFDFDRRWFEFIYQFSQQSYFWDSVAVFFAKYLPYLLVLGVFVLLFREKDWRRRLLQLNEIALALLLGRGLITETIRYFYPHIRPFVLYGFAPLLPESASSFPSGHTVFYFALALSVFFIDRTWGIWYFIFAFLIGLARVWAGVHWPSDILGGIVIGLASAFLVHQLLLPYSRRLVKEKYAEILA